VNEFFSVKVGSRFVFVSLMPTLLLVAIIGGLMAAGAPAGRPSWDRLVDSIAEIDWLGAAIVVIGSLVASVVLHPLSYPMIQFLEGYWGSRPLGRRLQRWAAARYGRWAQEIDRLQDREEDAPAGLAELAAWLPQDLILPTGLGNTLRAGEMRAGQRYGYRSDVVLGRLYYLMTPEMRIEVADTRNQLDTAARLCAVGMLMVPATLILLWNWGTWLLVPLACYGFAWASYRSAVAAARRFSDALSVAFDLHRLQLWDALSLRRPGSHLEEEQAAEMLSILLAGVEGMPPNASKILTYKSVPAESPETSGTIEERGNPTRRPSVGRGRRWLIRILGGTVL
jgi:hypothetical protein